MYFDFVLWGINGTELFRLAAAAFVTLLHIIRHEYYTSRTNCRKVSQIGEMSIEFYTPIHIQGGPKKSWATGFAYNHNSVRF